MGIEEMHVMFRELAQQMGIQTARAILPENIDICLNITIVDIVKELLAVTSDSYRNNDKVARNNAEVASINGLRTLYKVKTVEGDIVGQGNMVEPYKVSISDNTVMAYLSFSVSYDGKSLYDCRVIEPDTLSHTVHDACNRPTKSNPICVVYKGNSDIEVNIITGIEEFAKPTIVRYNYVEHPATVYYDEEDTSKNVDCNLPIHLHQDVVKRAVDVYLRSIGAFSKSKNND